MDCVCVEGDCRWGEWQPMIMELLVDENGLQLTMVTVIQPCDILTIDSYNLNQWIYLNKAFDKDECITTNTFNNTDELSNMLNKRGQTKKEYMILFV